MDTHIHDLARKRLKNRRLTEKGFTLAELAAVIAALALLALLSAVVLKNAVQASQDYTSRQEALYQAQTALSFTVYQIRQANGLKVTLRGDNSLRYLDLYAPPPLPLTGEHHYVIEFDKGGRRMNFGGYGTGYGANELISGIDNVIINIDEDSQMIYITISSSYENKAIALGTAVSFKGKEMR